MTDHGHARARRGSSRVGTVRPLIRADLPSLATALAEGPPSPRLVAFLADTLLDQPWADPAIPSLVYDEGGRVLGTVGTSVRRMRFHGAPVRVAVTAYLWSHPRVRERGVGARLLHELLCGPQDLTITDGATSAVRRMWEALGGRTAHLSSFAYARVLRPLSFGSGRLLRSLPRFARIAATTLSPLDALAYRASRSPLRAVRSDATSEPLSADLVVERLPEVTASLELVPDYDAPYVRWLFAHLKALDRRGLPWLASAQGDLWAETVKRRERILGWYVCRLEHRGLCRVLQVAAPRRRAPEVMRHLFARASDLGAAAVVGRVEPDVLHALETDLGYTLYYRRGHMLVHSRDPEIANAVVLGHALLTRLDGEWWLS